MSQLARPAGIDIASRFISQGSRVRELLSSADEIGAIYRLEGFTEALVITNDAFVREAHGVPLHCFLLAATPGMRDAAQAGTIEPDEEEVVLLRVTGTAALPDEGEMTRLRARAGFDLVREDRREVDQRRAAEQLIDALTEVEMQTSGVKCAVLGTFYDVSRGDHTELAFGSDMDNAYAWSRLRVLKPYGDTLRLITSFLQVMTDQEPSMFEIGTLRYASTQRREALARASGKPVDVPVDVNVADFVTHKTAVLGMTRLGKSNTMKTIATAVFRYAHEKQVKVGQLIFDPASEYAETNVQDQTALAELGAEHVIRYRFGATQDELSNDPGLRPLALNFFNEREIGPVSDLVADFATRANSAQYIQAFAAADVLGPEDPQTGQERSEQQWALRARALFYAALIKAGLEPPPGWTFWFPANSDLRGALPSLSHPRGRDLSFANNLQSGRGKVRVDKTQLLDLAEAVCHNALSDAPNQHVTAWFHTPDERVKAIAEVLLATRGGGYRVLIPLGEGYHSPAASADYAPEIYGDLVGGKIVIVDLSRGSEGVLQFASERVVNYLLLRAANKFRQGQDMDIIQVFLEEAHRLFDRDRFKDARATADPYVRLAREAAKYKIGMIYSTQQVSSVEQDVLDNTANWVVAHLNSESEVRLLRGRYEFDRFGDQIKQAEDRGFVRLKTLSSRYIVPVQVRLFDKAMIEDARAVAAGADGNRAGAQPLSAGQRAADGQVADDGQSAG
ncbi:MAG: hypothetical protein QOE69_1640 [Thermoleophilaceae bacterium]|jgi:hypothetical protein|nr:hypothetical protein [Thermoleophilaceae bacterium]